MSRELISYRLKQAEDSLAEAGLLLNAGQSYRGVVNRAYYAMFYSVLALQVKTGKASSKHSGMIALFDEHFVKPGIFSKDLSKTLHRAFDLRQMSDYRELFEIDKKEAEDCLNDATIFVSAVKNYFK